MWDLSCPDWRQRLAAGQSLVPDLPLIDSEADIGLRIFDQIRLPDVPEKPKLGDAAGQWFRDIVRAAFGSWDPATQTRYIRDIFAMASKGSSKTSYSAALSIAVMLMNRRPRAEALFVGPTQAISDRAYEQTVGMIEESPDLKRRFRPRDHIKTIEDLLTHSEMKVKTFDLNILTGSILIFALLDELHLLGRSQHTTRVLRQIRGGLDKTPEGLLLITTTQSDDVPAGAFKEELGMARRIRDGEFRGKTIRPMLPVLYEFPEEIARDREQWSNPENWPMVQPNLGRSVHLGTLIPDWESERIKGEHAVRIWASQYLNVEVGQALRADGWAGAKIWERGIETGLTLEALLARSEVVTVGFDGGGLDDLFGIGVIGRDRVTKRWLAWAHALISPEGMERRKANAVLYEQFIADRDLTLIEQLPDDIGYAVTLVKRILEAGLLAQVGVDAAGIGGLVDALAEIGVTQDAEKLGAVRQGIALMGAIKTIERKLVDGSFRHSGSAMMAWCVANAIIVPTPTAMRIDRAESGFGKIDPLMALFNAGSLMAMNPSAPQMVEEEIVFV
jgi:phage terminase large subunit-like protein